MKKQIQPINAKRKSQSPPTSFAGKWHITEMSNFDGDFLEESGEPAEIALTSSQYGGIIGSYSFSYSQGHIGGRIFSFGGETILIFGVEGTDDGDEVNTAGWLKLINATELAGEFVNDYGAFVAKRRQ